MTTTDRWVVVALLTVLVPTSVGAERSCQEMVSNAYVLDNEKGPATRPQTDDLHIGQLYELTAEELDIAGVVLVTVGYHVPRNNVLDGLDPNGAEGDLVALHSHQTWPDNEK